jgi:hypothetical protein
VGVREKAARVESERVAREKEAARVKEESERVEREKEAERVKEAARQKGAGKWEGMFFSCMMLFVITNSAVIQVM